MYVGIWSRLLAVEKYESDTRKAWVGLDCLYTGKDIKSALRNYNVDKMIQEIRMAENYWGVSIDVDNV